MPTSALATFARVLSSFRGHFTAPSFLNFVILCVGWLLAGDPSPGGCVTNALIAARVSGQLHWAAFHRFFSRATWNTDGVGHRLFVLLQPLVTLGWFEFAIDDTVAQKRGKRVFGASIHVDAVTSTKKRKNLIRGHCWVELGIVLKVPWSKRPWFVPLLSRLYRGKKEAGKNYRTKSALGREMLDLALTWGDRERPVRLLIDSGYMGKTMLCGVPLDRVTVIGSLKTNAALFGLPRPTGKRAGKKKRGRPCKKGKRLPTPAKMHHDKRRAWQELEVDLGGTLRMREVLVLSVQWYGVLGERAIRVVLVREDEQKLRVVLCTDPSWTAQTILEQGARRWSIEVWNRDIKQFLGFADSPAWTEKAVLRTAPWVALLSGILVVWFHRVYYEGMTMPLPVRPWYTWKEDLTFADLLRAAQETLGPVDVLTWATAIVKNDPAVFEGAVEEKPAVRECAQEVAKKAKAA